MKKFLGIVCSLVLILVAGVTFSACGNSDAKVTISAGESEFELVIGTDKQSKDVEFIVENFGNGSGQVNFSVEENEKGIVSLDSSYKGDGKTALTITGLKRGTARIVATSLQGSAKVILTVRVIQPITGLNLKIDYVNKLYVIRGGELNLSQRTIWNYVPSETNQTELEFSIIGNSQGCEIVDGKLVVSNTCGLSSVTVKATSTHNPEISEQFEVKILQPIELVLQIDGKKVVETVENSSSQILNFLEIFPRELDGSIYPNSKEVVLTVKAGAENEKLSIEKLFASDEAKFSIEQTGYSYDPATKLHIYKFLVQASSNEAGKIDSVVFNVSYDNFKAGEDDYSVKTTKLNINSYNKPLSVEVNGESGSTEIDVFENSIDFSNGKMIEFSILPGNIKLSENSITIWAEDFSNLPISLYKLNSTRTGYVCVFGYDQKGIAVGAAQNGVRYVSISSGTKLYAFINSNYNSILGTNKTAKIYAQASGFCNFTADSSARALTTIDFVINPNAKNISLAEKDEGGVLTKIDSTSIFVEIGKQAETYIAIDPNTFTIGSNSIIKIANDRIATVGELIEFAVDKDYVYGKFTIQANKVGSSTITVVLSDGKTKDFNLVVVSPLEKIEMDLEDVTFGGNVVESDIVPYKNIIDKEISVGETSPFVALNKLSIANSGGSGIQLVKTLTPSTAQYYLRYEFADFTLPEGSTLQNLTLEKVKEEYGEDFDNIWRETSNIINTSRLSNLSIIEAKNSGAEGNVLIKIAVYAMNSNGEYGTDPVGHFYYLVNFFVPVKGLTLTNGTLELYTYNTIGDKFVSSNGINRSINEFSVTVNPVNQGLTPTYLNNLEIYVNGVSRLTNAIFEERDNVVYLSKGGQIVSGLEGAALKVARIKDGNTFTFKIQAYSGAGNYIFALVLSEVNESKRFTAISRVVVSDAVEITDIDVVNASENDPISFNNIINASGEEEAIKNPFELELIYNIYGPAGKEITNSSLEFEIYWDKLSEKDHFINENGEKVQFASISDGKLTIKRAAYDYSAYYEKTEEERVELNKEDLKEFVKFGGEGYIRIYPTSNYFLSTNGWNKEDPIVEIPVSVADGNEISYFILSSEDLSLLSQFPTSNFELCSNIIVPSNYVPVEEFSGTLTGGVNRYFIETWCPLFKKITSTGVIENFYFMFESEDDASIETLESATVENGATYFGGLANINEGTIRNIGGTLENTEDIGLNASLTTLANKRKGILSKALLSAAALNTGVQLSRNETLDSFAQLIGGELVKYTGGLVGLNRGLIEDEREDVHYCAAIYGANVGGIAAVNEGTIRNTNFYGFVYGIESAGGIAAVNSGVISGCDVLTMSLFNVGVYIASEKAYSYSETPIEFAVGGIAAKSNGGIILNCKIEASTDERFDPNGFGSIIDVTLIDKESYCTVNGKPLGLGKYTSSFWIERNVFQIGRDKYTIDDYKNPTKITFTQNGETVEIAVVDNKFALGNVDFVISGDRVIESADFTSGTIYAGGLVGILDGDGKIQESIFSGPLATKQVVSGGLVGKLVGDGSSSTTRVENCYAVISYEEADANLSGLSGQFIGIGDLSEIKNSYVSSNGTLNYAGQGSGNVVSSYVNVSSSNISKFLELSNVFDQSSTLGDDYGMVSLDYALSLEDHLKLSWADLYQFGKIDYTVDTTGENAEIFGTVTMSGFETDPTSTVNFSFSLNKNEHDEVEPIRFTYKNIEYHIVINDSQSMTYLSIKANGESSVDFTDNSYSTTWASISFNKTIKGVTTESYDFRIGSLIESMSHATNSAYLPFSFEDEIAGEGIEKELSPSFLEIIYAKIYFVWIYNNFDDIVSNETLSGLLGAQEEPLTTEQYICRIFGLDESLERSEIKEEIESILTSIVLPQLNAGLADLKADITALKENITSFRPQVVALLNTISTASAAIYDQQLGEIEIIVERGLALTSLSEITFGNISTFKSSLDSICSALTKFAYFIMSTSIDGDEALEEEIYTLEDYALIGIYYASMLNVNVGNFAQAINFVDLCFKDSGMPTSIEGFKTAGWDIENVDEESNSIWVYEDGKLPALRNKKLAKRVSSFNVEINENNKFWRSYVNGENTSLVMFNYSVLGELTGKQQAVLNNLNSHNLSELFSLTNINGVEGETMSSDLFIIQSSNKSVVQIVGGKINIVGTGEATLTISPLNKEFGVIGTLEKKITIYVINPLGETQVFQGVSSNTNPINGDEISIYKNELNYLTIATKKNISLGNQQFNFVTNAMGYEIKLKDNNISTLFGLNGLNAGADSDKFAEGTLTIKPNENVDVTEKYEFLVKALLQKENQKFNNVSNLTYFVEKVNEILSQVEADAVFKAGILIKAEKVLISIKEAEIDPSSTVSVDLELQTTNTDDKLVIVIRDENNNVVWVSEDVTIDGLKYYKENNTNLFDVNPTIGKYESGRKKGTVLISVNENNRISVVKTSTYTVSFSDSSLEKSSVLTLKLKPQEILNVTYVHNNRTENSTENGMKLQAEPSSVLMPGDCGLLTIGLYPTYSNFKRIVLTSQVVDGQNYILLEQMYKSGEYYIPVSSTTGYSSVRDGNILTINKPSNPNLATNGGNIYVRTKMLDTVKEGLYFPINITIICEDESGNEYVSKSETITLLSETIDGAQITINGGKEATLTRGNTFPVKVSVNENQSLATVAPVNFKNGESKYDFVSTYFNTAEYEIVDGRKIYSGTITIGLDAEIEDDGVFQLQTIVNKVINGKYETATDSIEIRVVDFLVEGIKIKGNADDDNVFNTPAAIEKELEFEFALSKTPEAIESDQVKAIERINNAKEEFIKSVSLKQYFNENQQYVINTDRNFVVNSEHEGNKTVPSHLSNTNSSLAYDLFFTSDMTQYINQLTGEIQESKYFNIKYNGDKLENEMSATMFKVIGKAIGSVGMTIKIGYRVPGLDYDQYISYNFVINVQVYSDEDKPTPIENGEQFVEYLASEAQQYGETNFILMNNIVLENFVPFETTNFSSLDGNNKVITIKNFSFDNSTVVSLGLFQNVGSNSTIKNLVVNYGKLSNIVLGENVRSFNFGGIAVSNSGTIYNCEVVSLDFENNSPSSNGGVKVYFAEEGNSKGDDVSANIAGLVVTNNASVTNSRVGAKTSFREKNSSNQYVSKIDNFKQISYVDDKVVTTEYQYGAFNIVGQGNVSGFAITNNGVISSSYFANGKIVNQTASGAQSETAGFVVSNMLGATIFGSYVEGIKLDSDISVNLTGGGVVAQGVSAGFAYQNYGTISDCYTNIRLAGESTGRIVSGFVYNNQSSGVVSRCLSASTIVGQLTTQMPFSGKNAREEIMQKANDGLVNCYYLVQKQDTESILEEKYNTGAIALQISTLQSNSFYGFALTTGRSENDGVWSWDGILPQLVSANQKAISVRRVIKNYSSLIGEGASIETLNVYPYISGYEYGTQNNPIIIRSADEFNRVFGQETGLVKNAYYAISQMYNKNLGIVFGNYRLVSSINFDNLTYVENVKISSSIMELAKSSSNSGAFDGNALTISNIEISLDNQNSVGLFSKITSGGVVKNVNLTVKSIATGNSGVYAGAVAGYVSNSSLANISVEPVNETGENRSKISGQNIVGGVVGAVVGNSTVSNLISSISVVSGNAQANTDIRNYILNVLRNSATVVNGVVTDKNKDYSFAGGVVGILDIYEDINDQSVIYSTPNAKQLTFKGAEVSVQGSVVGGVVGYNGASTYLTDCSFILSGQEETISQRLITYANTIGGVVGINKGDLYELRIEHSRDVQKKIEDNLQNYYNNESDIFRGNTKLFNSTGTSSTGTSVYAGGIVGQMLGGELTVAYSRVDVSLANADYVGGAIGYANVRLDLVEVYAFGDVDGKVAGGIIGKADLKVSFERCVAMNFISKTNSHLLSAYAAANEFNAQGEEDGQWVLNGGLISKEGEDVTYSVVVSDGKVVEITLNDIKTLIGSHETNYVITDEVYGNEVLTFMNLTINFDKGNNESGEKPEGISLEGGISSYRGYDLDSTVINKMFLGAGWDASLWELEDGRFLPSFSYGVSAKTIYIEKTIDLLKLKKYYRGDNIIIFGDDPTTSFNPYEFDADDKSTYGTFTLSELQGLTVDVPNKIITFDISIIQSLVALGDGGTFFKRFLGIMYGEFGRTQVEGSDVWTYKIVNIEYPLFGTVKGGSISDLTFDNGGETSSYPVLANSIESRADLNYLTFTNIKINAAKEIDATDSGKKYAVGIVSATMDEVLSISNVTIRNCSIEIKDLTDSQLLIGAIAGSNVKTGLSTTVLNKVLVENFRVTAKENLKLIDGLMIGGFLGETSGLFEFKESQVTGSTFNVGLGTLDDESEYEGAQIIFVGGFVGNAQGKNIIHNLENNAQLTSDLTISVGEAATTYAGLLFGHVGELDCGNEDKNASFSGTIKNDDVRRFINGNLSDTRKPTTLVVGGAAGRANGVKIAGMKAVLTVKGLKTKSFTTGSSTVISSFGSLLGMLNGSAELKNVNYYEDISISGSDSTGSTVNENNAFAAGGLIGVVNGGGENGLTIDSCGYYGGLTVDYSADAIYIGGLVGLSNANVTFNSVHFGKYKESGSEISSAGEIRIEQVSKTANVGGIIGMGKGETQINQSEVTGEIVFPSNKTTTTTTTTNVNGAGVESVVTTKDSGAAISLQSVTLNVGLLAGSLSNGTISGNKVGGNISFNNSTITETVCVVGGLVGSITSGSVSDNYAWGNITLKNASLFDRNNKFAFESLTAGGLVGTTGASGNGTNKPEFSSNYSLTSLYITKTAQMANTNIGALVGTGAIDETSSSFYCHQINLATDTYGTNLYYKRGSSILSKLGDFVKGYQNYSKLNPTRYQNGNLEERTYYYLDSNRTFAQSDAGKNVVGHLVGDGYKISSSKTPFAEISGAVSGVSFVTTSNVEGSNAGRVTGGESNPPSGVAETNSGVIFAVVVEARGYVNNDNSFGNVRYSFNSGIAKANKGLIADSGVIFNVKSVYAGITQQHAVEKKDSGVVRNSYTTGAVHEVATTALSRDYGVLMNCYTALDAASISTAYTTIENVYYDRDALLSNSASKINGIFGVTTAALTTQKTKGSKAIHSSVEALFEFGGGTSGGSTGGSGSASYSLNGYWTIDYRVNFGYPYLGTGAYENFSYMKKYTGGEKSISSDFFDDEPVISDSEIDVIKNRWKAKLEYVRDYLLEPNWELYRIYFGGETYFNYIWINKVNGKYSLVGLATTPPGVGYDKDRVFEKTVEESGLILELSWTYHYTTKKLDEYPSVNIQKSKVIQIPNAGKLAQLQTSNDDGNKSYLYYDYQLLCNIDLTKVDDLSSWTPIGNNTNNFSGTFDGNDYVIYNIPKLKEGNYHTGFFGTLTGIVENCSFVYNNVESTGNEGYDVGGVVGQLINSGEITNVSTSGATIKPKNSEMDHHSFGGIVGSVMGGTIKNSNNYNQIQDLDAKGDKGCNLGGIAGYVSNILTEDDNLFKVQISNCKNFGAVSNGNYSGGIVGVVNSCDKITNCYNLGPISNGYNGSGGIVGFINEGEITECQNYVGISSNNNAGGIVGIAVIAESDKTYSDEDEISHKDEGEGIKSSKTTSLSKGLELQYSESTKLKLASDGTFFENKTIDFNDPVISFSNPTGSGGWTYMEWNKTFYLKDNNLENQYKLILCYKFNSYASGALWGNKWEDDCSIKIYSTNFCDLVSECYNSGAVTSSSGYAGGIVGRVKSQSTISNSLNTGTITSANFAGGIVGGTIPGGNENKGKIEKCTNKGEISGSNSDCYLAKIGNDVAVITDCYGGGSLGTGQVVDDNRNGNTDTTTDQSGVINKSNIYNWTSLTSKPTLKNGKYYVYTAQELAWLAANGSQYGIELMNNINLAGNVWNSEIYLLEQNVSKTFDSSLTSGGGGWSINMPDGATILITKDSQGYRNVFVNGEKVAGIKDSFSSVIETIDAGKYKITIDHGQNSVSVTSPEIYFKQNDYQIFNSNGKQICE